MDDYYDILNVKKGSSKNEIKKAYRKVAMKFHPDRNNNTTDNLFKNILHAYQIISDTEKRLNYDNYLLYTLLHNTY